MSVKSYSPPSPPPLTPSMVQSQTVSNNVRTSAKIQAASQVMNNAIVPATQTVAPQIMMGATNTTTVTNNTPSELLSAFECPVCMDYMLPPYLQCPSGHLVCGNCRPKVACCPSCRGPVPSIRNLAMERIAQTLIFPCKYAPSGCSKQFIAQEKIEHEEICEHRPYSCPCPGAACKWHGSLSEVMTHLVRQHKSITTLQGEDIVFLATDITLPGAVDWVMMQNCFNCFFMLVLEKQDKSENSNNNQQMFYAVVQLIGTKKEAENFIYRLELSSRRRRLSFEGTPRSIHEGVAASITQSDCLCFDTNQAQLFSENGNLGINVTIQKAGPSEQTP